jgi:hypothetical protein
LWFLPKGMRCGSALFSVGRRGASCFLFKEAGKVVDRFKAQLADSEDPFVAQRAEEFMATQKDSI